MLHTSLLVRGKASQNRSETPGQLKPEKQSNWAGEEVEQLRTSANAGGNEKEEKQIAFICR